MAGLTSSAGIFSRVDTSIHMPYNKGDGFLSA